MASKRHKRRKCGRKRTFQTIEGAWKCLNSLPAEMTWGQKPYRCPVCGKIHLGHCPGFYRENINLRALRSGR